jgi:hypothetical protein
MQSNRTTLRKIKSKAKFFKDLKRLLRSKLLKGLRLFPFIIRHLNDKYDAGCKPDYLTVR